MPRSTVLRATAGDTWLAAGCGLAVIVEALWREELAQRPLSVALGLVLAGTLWFRRSHPLAATAVAFGLITASTLAQTALGLPEVGPYAGACVLLLPYALGRWGSRRAVALGLVFMAAAHTASMLRREVPDLGDTIGGAVFLFFPVVLGLSLRFRAAAQARDLEHAKLREREQLARELHDSVAHHVTAITIQAQAARAVLASRPEAAEQALIAIETESRRTLAELREIVGALREDGAAFAPAGRIADIAGLARSPGAPALTVELSGDLEGLPASVERALYRLAQESLTNTIKHARDVTRVAIRVWAEGEHVHLTARDDGAPPGPRRGAGFGLVGMAERAASLGGTFSAGPAADGWQVDATLPRTGGSL
jgi:signal transduction histidine kinase